MQCSPLVRVDLKWWKCYNRQESHMNKIIKQYHPASGITVDINLGDITKEDVDAIVNAANAYLQHGGGVAGVISLTGGPVIQEESDRWISENGPVQHASPAYTSGGKLPCRYVIHAVGPVWGEGDEARKLAEAVEGSLKLGDQLGVKSIAFPAISTGIFRFPVEGAAKVILQALDKYLRNHPETRLEQIRLVLFDKRVLTVFLKIAKQVFEDHQDSVEVNP